MDTCTPEDVYGVGGCPRGLTRTTASLSTSASLLQVDPPTEPLDPQCRPTNPARGGSKGAEWG
eukprot:9481142-Pyramimonas_sp.AAC.1